LGSVVEGVWTGRNGGGRMNNVAVGKSVRFLEPGEGGESELSEGEDNYRGGCLNFGSRGVCLRCRRGEKKKSGRPTAVAQSLKKKETSRLAGSDRSSSIQNPATLLLGDTLKKKKEGPPENEKKRKKDSWGHFYAGDEKGGGGKRGRMRKKGKPGGPTSQERV